ncbi:hypothetical protein ACHAWO_005087 [Cyclotella atomus]|uniref:RING-type E3 ubiquitin transferase n=1 Tax=Cyclotella atomus TaxID=382360 RepID=A0ABD3PAX1_9STRA
MPKRQKEKQYQSAREHRANQSLYSNTPNSSASTRPLPFDCCALTLTPFTTPVCTPDGIIFENSAIFPHLMKYSADPVTGRPMKSRDLITLHMDKDESTGKWQCPILNKTFTDRTKVVAIRHGNEAYVYSYEAYHELNVKPKNYVDLTTGEKFTKQDVIVLQDPEDKELARLRDVQNFKHIQNLRDEKESKPANDVKRSLTAERIMEKLDKEKNKRAKKAEEETAKLLKLKHGDSADASSSAAPVMKIYTDELLVAVNQTSGKASGSFTSTSMNITSKNSAREATEDEIVASQCEQLRRLKQKGVVRIFTNMGAMDAELHCDIVPRTTMNFLLLAENKEYCGSKFHRSIPNFMLQGGKSAKDKGEGSSYWKKPFPDEFDERLKHEGQGVLSMANSGPGTNGRQFFITYKSCPHLNRKHSVFGKVIGGLDVLRRLEEVPTDIETDRPMHTIRIEDIEILENPLKEALEIEKTRILKRKQEKEEAGRSRGTGLVGVGVSNNNNSNSSSTSAARPAPNLEDTANDEPIGIGKYMKSSHMDKPSKKRSAPVDETGLNNDTAPAIKSRLPPPPKKTSFGDFSGW